LREALDFIEYGVQTNKQTNKQKKKRKGSNERKRKEITQKRACSGVGGRTRVKE
jgi:hypothetical protein